MREALALHPRVERDHVYPAGAALVRGARDLPRQHLFARVGRDPHDLARLDVRAEADDEVGEPARQVGDVPHDAGAYPDRMHRCA